MSPEKLKRTLAGILREFSSGESSSELFPPGPTVELSPEEQRSLPSFSVFLTLVAFSRFSFVGRREKIAWSIPIRFKGVSYELVDEKFGLRIYVSDSKRSSIELDRELVRCLRRAVRISDGLLEPYGKEQLSRGNITVPNRYGLFREMYEFLRQRAMQAYSTSSAAAEQGESTQELVARLNQRFQSEREGFFQASASLDAYFSLLEHTLVLLLPFAGFDPLTDDLEEFLGSKWQTKFKRIFEPTSNPAAGRVLQSLMDVKERLRNTIFHGGFEKGGTSLYFHVPSLGAIPMSLSRYSEGINFSLHPIDQASFVGACQALDSADAFLSSSRLHLGLEYIKAGLDVAFDEKSRKNYKAAMRSEGDMNDFIEAVAELHDRCANMDW